MLGNYYNLNKRRSDFSIKNGLSMTSVIFRMLINYMNPFLIKLYTIIYGLLDYIIIIQ